MKYILKGKDIDLELVFDNEEAALQQKEKWLREDRAEFGEESCENDYYILNASDDEAEYALAHGAHTVRYRIHEIETNTTYDDNYYTIDDAQKQIEQYEKDDADPDDPREESVTYEVIEVYDLPRKAVYFVAEGDDGCGIDGGLYFFTRKEAEKEAHDLLRTLRRECADFEHSHNRFAQAAATNYYSKYVVIDRYIVDKCEITGMTAEKAYNRAYEILRDFGEEYVGDDEIFCERVVD